MKSATPVVNSIASKPQVAAPVNILLVDDEPRNLNVLESVLISPDYRLVRAETPDAALLSLVHADFACIVLDIQMPGMNGIELARLIKTRKRTQHVPIIFLTAYFQDDKDVLEGYDAGAVDYLTKPINPQILRSKVDVFARLFRGANALAAANNSLEQEITQRLHAEEALRRANAQLEARVAERTADLTRANRELRKSEERMRLDIAERKRINETLEAVLKAIPDVVFVIGSNGKIAFKNPAASRLLEEMGGSNTLPEPVRDEIVTVLKTGEHLLPKNFKALHKVRVRDGERYFLNRVVVMAGNDEKAFGAVAILQDVTELRLLDEVKTNLIATVSHELKTPITSVRNALHLLREEIWGPLNEKQLEFVSVAHEEVERLVRTVNSLLDLTRFENDIIDAPLENQSPQDLVRAALMEVRVAADHASVRVNTDVPDELPTLRVDRSRILHVLTNLLTNAIKHSPPKSDVLVRATRDPLGVCFRVKDCGPGVPLKYQARLFDKFFRVPDSPAQGTGLGLWIARQFVLAHGGRIGLHSEPGKGAEFYFILPHEVSEAG